MTAPRRRRHARYGLAPARPATPDSWRGWHERIGCGVLLAALALLGGLAFAAYIASIAAEHGW